VDESINSKKKNQKFIKFRKNEKMKKIKKNQKKNNSWCQCPHQLSTAGQGSREGKGRESH
jgi:hypothetical protein